MTDRLMRRPFATLVLTPFVTLLLAAHSGCGPARAVVTGEVKADGEPLKKGLIVFATAGQSDRAEIRDGRYEIHTIAGAARVQISEDLGVDKKKEHNGPGAAWIEVPRGEGLPAKYNSASELTLDVPAGSSSKDWTVSRR